MRNKAKNKGISDPAFWPLITIVSVLFLLGIIALVLKFNNTAFCANSISCVKDLSNRVENGAVGTFAGHQVTAPPIDLTLNSFQPAILGTGNPNGPKHIYVDLSNQTVTAYEGDTLVLKALISSGKWGRTPTGEFAIWIKVRSQRMSGGQGADYYDLPNVPYVMFFAGGDVAASRGYSLHGAYWHNNFGHPMSHGCVNMRPIDAEVLYNWADPPTVGTVTRATTQNPGTPVTIFGTIPES